MSDYTRKQKLDEVEREIAMRLRHYPGMVARGDLPAPLAQQRIEVMKAIAEDYRRETTV